MQEYLEPGEYIDSDDMDVRAFAAQKRGSATTSRDSIINVYYAVRDEIFYDPLFVGTDPQYFRASDCLRARRGFCIPKSALLAACARVLDIPARVGYADVKNHLSTPKLDELVGGNVYTWHSYTDLYLDDRWIKATPVFNIALCERFGVHPLDFDGQVDSLFQEYDRAGQRHMQYLKSRGEYADVPFETIVAAFRKNHPRWLENRSSAAAG